MKQNKKQKSKMRLNFKELIAVFIIQLVFTIPFYTINASGLTISNVRAAKVLSNSATVEWNTDNMSNGKVRYGKTTALGFTQRHDNFIQNHTVNVFNGIESDTNYFFAVESADFTGNTAIDNNSNNFYTFKTTDITPPPQVTGLMAVSATSNSIFLSWNNISIPDFDHYIIYKNRIQAATSTANSFNDTGLSVKTDFNYKVSAVDKSGNEGPLSDTLIASTSLIDSEAPVIINVDVLTITDTAAKVTWLTNENATTIVLYGMNKTDKIKSSNDLIANHSITIDGLVKNVNHIFIAKSCDASNNCANSSAKIFLAGRDVKAPFINLSIPRFVNRRVIDIIGSTEQFSSVALFLNNMNLPKRSLSSNEVGSTGKFVFSQLQLEQDNIIKFVMVDKSGNRNEKTFEVSIDTEDPIVQLSNVPAITSNRNLTISGTVNEPVTINIFLEANVNEITTPSKVTGLRTTKVGKNSIEMQWDESKDKEFSHYVVYREDASPIAITKPANFNLFIDALADSGKTYTYQVSAVNIFAREGQKSEPVTATTAKGGDILNIRPPEVDIFEDFRKPLLAINATSSFSFGILLSKGDGSYKIKLIFEDRADNSVIFERNTVLDTKKPEVKITSPPSGALVFENVANEIDVIGKTKPNSRVHLFVDRTPFSFFNQSFEISGLPNEVEIQKIAETELDAKCRSNLVATSFCRTGADFSVTADAQGDFKFERVDLTEMFGGAARLREVPVTQFRDTELNPEKQESRKVTLVVIATDHAGQRGSTTHTVRIGTCWSGNQSWDIIPLTQFQSPTFLSPERLAEGTQTVYFYLNYSYIGAGTGAVIQTVSIAKACSAKEIIDPRFNISCQIMPAGNSPIFLNKPENTLTYSAMPLARFPGMDRFLEKDWRNLFKAVNNEFTFPIKLTIKYQHDKDNDGKLETEFQTTCEQVTYVLDNAIIDPRKFLPDWLLFDAVDILQESVKTIDKVQQQLGAVLQYLAFGCLTSIGLIFIVGAYRRWVSFLDERTYAILGDFRENAKVQDFFGNALLQTKNPNDQQEQQSCKELIQTIGKNKNGFKMKYLTDADLSKCFPSTAAAWEYEENIYQLMRWSCDRVFGHSSPAGWTENRKDDEITTKLSSPQTCANDQSERGQPLRPEKCRELAKTFTELKRENFDDNSICFRLQTKEGSRTFDNFYKLGDPIGDDLYRITKFEGLSKIEISYAKKINENNYLTASQLSCEELCGVTEASSKDKIITFNTLDGKELEVSGTKPSPKPNDAASTRKIQKIGITCTTVDKCRSFNQYKKEPLPGFGATVDFAYTSGYSSKLKREGQAKPCFFTGNNPKAVSKSTAEREECCCINGRGDVTTHYYAPDDIDTTDPTAKKPVHESKTKTGQLIDLPPVLTDEQKRAFYADMKWSYRYSKERFVAVNKDNPSIEHYEYNPNRYIEGRDKPACLGQDSWWDSTNVVTLNPAQDHLVAVQCLHLGGVMARLQFIKNLMTHFSSCLIQVRTTGRGDAGVCRELFTQYVCSGMWQVIRWFIDGCLPTPFGELFKPQYSDDLVATLKGGLKGIYESGNDLQSTITSEYGNAKLNNLMGIGEESLARKICLAAFGYDWEFDFKSFVDAAYSVPFATLVQAVTRSREFETIEPGTLKPKYEYRASWLINPGCDFERYDVYLSCVGRKQLDKYPNSVSCGSVGAPSLAYTGALPGTRSAGFSQCDCIGLADEKPGPLVFSGRLKQNVLEDKAIPLNQRVISSDVRYDHLKIVLQPDRKITANIKPNCFPSGYEDGVFYFPLIDKTARDLLDCQADLTQGLFVCKPGQLPGAKKGTASFLDLKLNGTEYFNRNDLVFNAGDTLEITTTIRNVGSDKCLKVSLDGENQVSIIKEGILQYQVPLRKALTIGTLEGVQTSQGVTIGKIDLQNSRDISFSLRFYDVSGNDRIEFNNEDLIEVGGTAVEGKSLSNNKRQFGTGNDAIELVVRENILVVKKLNAEIEITAVEINRGSDGKPSKIKNPNKLSTEVGNAYAQVTAKSPLQLTQAQTSQQTQTKTLIVGLYHIRSGLESADENPDNCDLNKYVYAASNEKQERRISFRVEQKPISTISKGAVVGAPLYKPIDKKVKKEQGLEITVRVINNDRSKDVVLDCSDPNGDKIGQIKAFVNGLNYMFTFKDFKIAGQYKCNILAPSIDPKAGEGKQEVEFEVLCGGDGNIYGSCQPSCIADRDIQTGLKCKSVEAEGTIEDIQEPCCRI